ncbi:MULTISPECIES: RidA family protein [Pseudomonas]|uniref:RidA family protein n=1 Tax=Pseudomonas TaxID=286 RepID=UPI00086358A7|nr:MULTISPECIES: RidA family protein [Pseudomonas]MDG9889990.1 RidA family protein [Pseudomonas juntendi]QOH70654.1 RidA family protein [Pseudomonas putida]RFQ03459.1 RidA family protein [Pseudomonas putida]
MTTSIVRHQTNERMSRIVIHGSVAYLAGVIPADRTGDIKSQTREVLDRIDELLASIGTDKRNLLTAQIWLKDMQKDFQGMNEVWDAWVPQGEAPTRATCEASLNAPTVLVEVIVTAAV